MSDIEKRLADLAPEKRAILERRLFSGDPSRDERITRREGQGPSPLSFPQRRLWFLSQLEPGLAAYNDLSALRLRGRLDRAALQRSLAEVARRHEALTTVFVAPEGKPLQHVLPAGEVPLAFHDLRAVPAQGREQEAHRLAADAVGRPMDLERGPLFHAVLVRLDDDDHALILIVHHIMCDGWGRNILLCELGALYASFEQGRASPLPELTIQYADFAAWQQRRFTDEALEPHLAYWSDHLAGAPILELPTDRPRPPLQSYRGQMLESLVEAAPAQALFALARAEKATPFMALMALFRALLSRYSGQDDVVIGTPIAGRMHVETESLIGYFANTLALRGILSPDMSLRELLRRERDLALAAFARQEAPFEKLVEKLSPERNLAYPVLCQAMLSMRNMPRVPPSFGSLASDQMWIDKGMSRVDLTLFAEQNGGGVHCRFEYNSDLFSASRMERMARHFASLIAAAAAAPDRPLARLPMLSDAERRQLLVDWNPPAPAYPRDRRVEDLFDEVAAGCAGSMAVRDGECSLTYGELASRANRLARRLRAMGVGGGTPVGIFLNRSCGAVTAMLAVLKAGGVYAPVDTAYPAERVAFILEDTAAKVVLTDATLAQRLPLSAAAVLLLDKEPEASAADADSPFPAAGRGGGDAAYVLYTSGSTGRPKGVLVHHRGILRLVKTDWVRIDASDAVAQITSLGCDISTWEIWSALLNGGRLEILEKDLVLSPAEFAAEVRRRGVTAAMMPASLVALIAAHQPDAFSCLSYLIPGSEPLDPSCLRRILAAGAPRRIINSYGPTECTVCSTWDEIRSIDSGATVIPIGMPIPGDVVHVLDRNLELLPVGVPGEACIGGEGVAIGYLGREDLTRERFVETPLGRLYRTGDLVRRLEDGRIEFISRIDRQVKIRGFRIEPGEIEAALTAHPLVGEAAVLCREDAPGEKRLVAYVVGDEGSAEALDDFVRERLPSYMVPSAYVMLDALPHTPNGKIDRAALPAPAMARAAARIAPSTPLEREIARLWAEILVVDDIAIDDDFFALGGHSLRAAQAAARIEQSLGVRLALRAFMERPTVRAQAEAVLELLAVRAAESGALGPMADRLYSDNAPPRE